MRQYRHIVQYYETDRMGITHHSNYIRWMEEARVHFLKEIGWSYKALEDIGVTSPVIGVEGTYKTSTTFDDEVFIEVSVKEIKGAKLILNYDMRKNTGEMVFQGISTHCFINSEGRIIRLEREYPVVFAFPRAGGGLDTRKSAFVPVGSRSEAHV